MLQWGLGLSTEESGPFVEIITKAGRLQWGLGLSTEESQRPTASFQIPTWLQWGLGLSTEERRNMRNTINTPVMLQWGLGLSTEERWGRSRTGVFPIDASMGPRSFNRGKIVDGEVDRIVEEKLQWGLGLSTEESSFFGFVSFTGFCFNGASVFQPRKGCSGHSC